MRLLNSRLLPAVALLALAAPARAGFDPQIGQPGSLGIPKDDPSFRGWATSVVEYRPGPRNVADPSGPLATGNPQGVLGDVNSPGHGLASLGDGGWITLGFDRPLTDGDGADFAVFENGILSGPSGSPLAYLELAFVEVSTDGVHFFRFPATSLTQTDTQVGGFGLLDASNLNNLAGKYVAGYGAGFDLSELAGISPLLDVNNVNYVRLVDVVGSIDPALGSYDSLDNMINDPYSTPFNTGGFDLTGVGVINQAPAPTAVPEPASLATAVIGLGMLLAAVRARRRG